MLTAPSAPHLTNQAKLFDYNLETLRGIAALLVVWGHSTVTNGWIDPKYYPIGVWSYVGPAHLSVLVFFLLSGYVIGLAHVKPLTLASIPTYIKKRFVRIYPIYFLCLLFALAVAEHSYPLTTIISHLTMTQGLLSPVIKEISPAWSLTYEIIFYLLFIPISIYRINAIVVAVAATVAGIVSAYTGSPLFPSYAFGFAFWLCGLALARQLPKYKSDTQYAYMLSFLLLFMAIGKLDAPVSLFHQVALRIIGKDLSLLSNNQPGVVAFRDFGYLPYCLIILIVFVGKEMKWKKSIMAVLLALPMFTYYHYYKHYDNQTVASVFLPTLFYGLAIVFFVFSSQLKRWSESVIKRLIVTGSISYGLYILHFPILYVFGHNNAFSGSSFTFVVRLIIFLSLSIGGAYILEKQLQPRIKAIFN